MSEDKNNAMSAEDGTQEPSMEDILSSIRRIIADDDGVQAVADVQENMSAPQEDVDTSATEEDTIADVLKGVNFLDGTHGNEDLTLGISDIDESPAPKMAAQHSNASNVGEGLDLLTAGDSFNLAIDTVGNAAPESAQASVVESEDDVFSHIEGLLDLSEDDLLIEDTVSAPDEEVINEVHAEPMRAIQRDKDLDLVKSLMADLMDDQFMSDEPISPATAAPMPIETENLNIQPLSFEMPGVIENVAEVEVEEKTEESVSETAVIDEALNLALDGELSFQMAPESLVGPEIVLEDTKTHSPVPVLEPVNVTQVDDADNTHSEHRTLSQIAAEAREDASDAENDTPDKVSEAEFDVSEATMKKPLPAAIPVAAALASIASPKAIEKRAPLAQSAQIDSVVPKESSVMQPAVAQDTIISDVTEEAASSAFASLNHLVDAKSDEMDRGDRIGDLVHEALKPLLKQWLDANLQGIVERAVAKEVKRIASGN